MAEVKQEFIQQLTVSLNGGQTLSVPFHAASADKLNPQIEDFFKCLADKNKQDGVFVFQGARVVLIRIADVSAADVVSLIKKQEAEAVKKTEK